MERSDNPPAARQQLGQELARLRGLAGLTLREVSARTGHRIGDRRSDTDSVPHARLSRAEAGTALLSTKQTEKVLAAVSAPEAARDRVHSLLDAAHTDTVRWRSHLRRQRHAQDLASGREQTSFLICTFSVDVVPGLLQTGGYARAVLERVAGHDAAAALNARLERQEVLYDSEHRFRFVLARRVLGWKPDPEVSMPAQLDRLRQLDELDNVEIRVLDDNAPPMHPGAGFVLYDETVDGDPFVTFDLLHGGPIVTDPDDVGQYRELFGALRRAADRLPGRS